ncbi:hypothetical protein Dred_1516 [Desulforamulus reducens MI-1]|uniref:Uncharacterized protein n=1 Tax=Desulforamulus reducens (strain ATCC BAA-1160 / DSM 100696 / MI-1) TaxID=349161 RepID=A4J4P3_DESRM|nr:hypothetical protein [Desulforamulus reducens]ABO50046.1 hypothetical protein Dred_1516 [Desulforamulus reducens MI-1]
MNAWWHLVKKEYRMTRTLSAVLLGILIIAGLWVMYSNQDHLGIVLAPASLLIICALFYPAFYMLTNVSSELKQTPHLWLHCPQPAWMLLTAKLVMAVVVMLAILLVDAVFIYLTLFSLPSEQIGTDIGSLALFVTELGTYVALAIIGASIYMAAWTSLMAVATASTRNILGRFNWLAGLATLIAATWGLGKIQQTWLFQKLTHWGAFNIHLLSVKRLFPQANGNPLEGLQLYAGQIFMVFIVTVAVLALSSWLIDNKVEV